LLKNCTYSLSTVVLSYRYGADTEEAQRRVKKELTMIQELGF